MRVLTFLHSFKPGGVERVALRLVGQWRAQGVDALVQDLAASLQQARCFTLEHVSRAYVDKFAAVQARRRPRQTNRFHLTSAT
jgi:hypothetical protein